MSRNTTMPPPSSELPILPVGRAKVAIELALQHARDQMELLGEAFVQMAQTFVELEVQAMACARDLDAKSDTLAPGPDRIGDEL